MCLKITHLKLQTHLAGANKFILNTENLMKNAGLILGLHPANERR